MTWRIQLPHRGDRSAPLSTVAEAARHLPADEDREVTRQLVLDWRLDGLRTVGEALDHLDQLAPAERRALLDRTRAEVGLPNTHEVDAQRRAANPLVLGPAPATPTTELRRRDDGTFYEVPLTPMRFGIGPSGQPIDLNQAEAEAARQRAREESDRAQRASQASGRQADAATAHEHERARAEQLRAELPEHLRGAA